MVSFCLFIFLLIHIYAVENVDWPTIFLGLDVGDMTELFTSTCSNIFSLYISNNVITCIDRDPPWMTATLKSAIKRKHSVYNKYVNMRDQFITKLPLKLTEPKTTTFLTWEKLSDPTNGSKSYWATLNKIINKKRFSSVPPLLENGLFVTNFQNQSKHF